MLLGQTCGLIESVLNILGCDIVEVVDGRFHLRFGIGSGSGTVAEMLPLLQKALTADEPIVITGIDTAVAPQLLHVKSEEPMQIAVRIGGRKAPFGLLVIRTDPAHLLTSDELEFLCAIGDLTGAIIDSSRAQEALAASEHRFQALVENSSDGLLLVDENGLVRYAGPSTTRILHLTPQELQGTPVEDLVAPEYVEAWRRLDRALRSRPGSPLQTEMRLRKGEEGFVWIEASATNLLANPAVAAVVLNYRDVTERKETERQLERLAYRDSLTGLPNRFLFNDRVRHAIDHARRRGHGLALMYVDLDRFKLVNDTLGHAIGDELLQAVAARLRGAIRADDTIARLGGDEFAILLPDVDRGEHAGSIGAKLLLMLKEPFTVRDHQLYAAASIGVSMFPDDGADVEILLKNADSALYRAKELGRNNVQLFTAAMNARYQQRLNIEMSLRHAIESESLEMFYQPIIDNHSGHVRAVEGLMRWQRDGEAIAPSLFIAVAEETGLITRIGEFAIRRACRDLRTWREAGLHTFQVSINLSAHDLRRPDIVPTIAGILEENGIEPKDLQFEITESAALDNIDLAMETLTELRRLGARIAVDDFGTGQSSLAYLKRLPLDVVKLDREFLRDTTNSMDMALLASIIDLVHSLHLYIVAEGIETDSELRLLRMLNCDGSQGFVFSRAVPADCIPAVIERFAARNGL